MVVAPDNYYFSLEMSELRNNDIQFPWDGQSIGGVEWDVGSHPISQWFTALCSNVPSGAVVFSFLYKRVINDAMRMIDDDY